MTRSVSGCVIQSVQVLFRFDRRIAQKSSLEMLAERFYALSKYCLVFESIALTFFCLLCIEQYRMTEEKCNFVACQNLVRLDCHRKRVSVVENVYKLAEV